MTHAIRFYETGAPDVLKWEEIDVPKPQTGEVTIRQTAVGVNFIDTNQRKGAYPVKLPSGLGLVAAGVIEDIGAEAGAFKKGDRVAYATGPLGAYAEVRNFPVQHLVKLPDDIDDKTAAALMMRGLTAWYLLFRTYKVQKGDTIVVHAAAGGVGQNMARWAKHVGATVIGLVGSKDKVDIAKQAGCDHVLISRDPFADKVRDLTGGRGAAAVYDSVGKDTFMQSLDSLKPLGTLAAFGTASGPIPQIDPKILADKGSLFLTRPSLKDYVAERSELETGAKAMFEAIRQGILKPDIQKEFKLEDAANAHEALEGRKLTGTIVLLP
jgi:NADPH2:quinone reductase